MTIKKQEVDINLNINVDVTNPGRNGISAGTQISLEKVETDMSVAQIAYLCRIFYDLGYFKNKNQTEMLKVAANSFITINSQEISLKSLKAKYYNVDKSTKESIKKRVLEMLNYVNRKES